MRGYPMSEEFTCPNCRSQSVVYPDAQDDGEARVLCRTCGTFLGTLAQFRRRVEARTARAATFTSGC
jgi:ribosomal protein S27E